MTRYHVVTVVDDRERRFTAEDLSEALGIMAKFDNAFEDAPHSVRIVEVESGRTAARKLYAEV